MENKLISNYSHNYEIKNHPNIKGMQIIEGKNNFPISWLNKQGYCEYQLYLEHLKGVEVGRTAAMKRGSEVHEKLEEEFKKTATPATFDEAIEISKEKPIISREVFVISPKFGIRGFIDEIQITPTEIIVIDDKPGTVPYNSMINQVRAYCLCLKEMLNDDKRVIKGALRQRDTANVFWTETFDREVEKSIKFLINRMEGLFDGTKPFVPTKNKNKCKSCRYQSYCEHF